jgi:hypothetical protein
MTDEAIPKPGQDLIKRILAAGADAGRVALEAGHKAVAMPSARYSERLRAADTKVSTDELVDRVVRAHVMLARSEGAAAGGATSAAEVTTVVGSGGTLTLPAAVVITAADLTALAWIQLRMVLIIAALHGHDASDPARLREFLSLQGASGALGAPGAARPAAAGAGRVAARLINRHLRGPALATIKSLFRAAGINFARAGLLRQLFVLNIPINAAFNDVATRRLANKARSFYRTSPAAP